MDDVYLDTSFLLKLYVLEKETPVARAHLQRVAGKVVVSSLSDVEVISSLSRRLPIADAAVAKATYRQNRLGGVFLAPGDHHCRSRAGDPYCRHQCEAAQVKVAGHTPFGHRCRVWTSDDRDLR